MNTRSLDKTLAALATLCAVTVGAMVVAIVVTRSSQDFFQTARPVQAYAAYLAETPLRGIGLPINLGLDNLFLILYAAFFVLLAARLRGLLEARILTVALTAMLVTASLDALENNHIMEMIHAIETGLPVMAADGEVQMMASQIKFHASYLAVLLFSFGLFRLGMLGRLTAISLWIYVPLGVAISVLPPDATKLLALGRTVFFVFAFILSARLFFKAARSDGQAPV